MSAPPTPGVVLLGVLVPLPVPVPVPLLGVTLLAPRAGVPVA